jgi:hypothetical protein
MLKLISRFVLEVLPYMLSALIAAIVVPGFLMSQLQLHGNQPAGASNSADGTIRALELVHSDHAPFASRQTLSRRSSSAVDQLVAK